MPSISPSLSRELLSIYAHVFEEMPKRIEPMHLQEVSASLQSIFDQANAMSVYYAVSNMLRRQIDEAMEELEASRTERYGDSSYSGDIMENPSHRERELFNGRLVDDGYLELVNKIAEAMDLKTSLLTEKNDVYERQANLIPRFL